MITNSIESMLDFYITNGCSIIPLIKHSKEPAIYWETFQKQRPDANFIKITMKKLKECNWGIVCGEISNVTVIDLDNKEYYYKIKTVLDVESIPTVETKRGYHLYFQYNPEINTSKFKGLDIKNNGGYVVAPPSTVEGHCYRWIIQPNFNSLPQITKEQLEEIISLLFGNKAKISKNIASLYQGVPEGERNISLTKLCGSWLHDGLSPQECLEMGLLFAQRCTPPMSEEEVKKTIFSIYKRHSASEYAKKKMSEFKNKLLTFPLVHNKGIITKQIVSNYNNHKFTFNWKVNTPNIKEELLLLTDTLLMKIIQNNGIVDLNEVLSKDISTNDIILCIEKLINTTVLLSYETIDKNFMSFFSVFSDANINLNGSKQLTIKSAIKKIENFSDKYFELDLPTRVLYRNLLIENKEEYNINILADRILANSSEDVERSLSTLRKKNIIKAYCIEYSKSKLIIL